MALALGTEIFKAAIVAAFTLVVGAVLFGLSQMFQKAVIEPATEQRRAIGEVDYVLTVWAWAYANPADDRAADREKAITDLRAGAARLRHHERRSLVPGCPMVRRRGPLQGKHGRR